MVFTKDKIVSRRKLISLTSEWKASGLKVVFTNGCFDIIHLGHVDYLEKAKILGDKLIVGLNSDDSVRRLKGINRPINSFIARSRVMAAFEFVDAVIEFRENTPLDIIKFLAPDVLVKGKDYDISNIIGADIVVAKGGTIETIKFVEDFSTTEIINKIKKIK